MKQSNRDEKLYRVLFDIGLFVFFALSFYLFYNQQRYNITNQFESDTYAHIQFAVEEGFFYSFTSYLYYVLSKLVFAKVWIGAVLSFVTVGSVVLTVKLFRVLFANDSVSEGLIYLFSFLANFVSAFYLPFVNKQHYIGYECANMWHNSTYLFMRFFALISILLFIRLLDGYTQKTDIKTSILFSVCLCITTGIKASFLLVFAPTVFVVLLYKLITTKNFKTTIAIVLTSVLSFLVILWQSVVLFGEETSNATVIAPFHDLSLRGEHAKVTLVLSILYPLVVFAFHAKEAIKNKYYLSSLIMAGIGFLEVFLFAESGERAGDGNFFWGYSIALFFWFITSLVISVSEYRKSKKKAVFIVQSVIGGWQVIAGVWYFALLLTGVTYFI